MDEQESQKCETTKLTMLSPPIWKWQGIKQRFAVMTMVWWCCFWTTMAFIGCDVASTIHFMLRDGPDAEIHPGFRYMAILIGPVAGPIVGGLMKQGAYALLTLLFPKAALPITILSVGLFGFAALWNYGVI